MNFEVNRTDFRETRTIEPDAAALTDGQVRLAVERFAVTTNNVTYAVAGDMLDYWGFFPAEAGWGRVPVMGLASVVESANPDIEIGGRYFGFYPMSDTHVITARATKVGFRDVGPHRANHAVVYTDFVDLDKDGMFRVDRVDEYLLLRGLFFTSFLVDDYLADNDFKGAGQTLVTSASSKTSISLAECLKRRGQHSVGLTSERNRDFVTGLGLYDEVITYDEVDQLDAAMPSGMVDMAGNAAVRAALHNHFGDNMKFSLTVGVTHWEADSADDTALPGAVPEFFFAPTQGAKRTAEWGPDGLAERIGTAFHEVLEDTSRWLTVEHHTGADGMATVYGALVEGTADPSLGFIVEP